MSEFKLPTIKGNDLASLTSSISNYLYQLVEQLNQTTLALSKDITETEEKVIASQPENKTQEDKQQDFDSIKGLIIKSSEIIKAYYESLKLKFSGEYLAGGDFGEYVESTVTDIEVSNSGITTIVRRDEKTSCDGIVNNRNVISKINQSAESVTIEADKIALEGYTTINNGFSVDLNGNMTCNDAIMHDATIDGDILFPNSQSKIVGGQGLYSTLTFRSGGIAGANGNADTGYTINGDGDEVEKRWVCIDAFIPSGFTITSAYLTLVHTPHKVISGYWMDASWQTYSYTNLYCYAQQIALYKATSIGAYEYDDASGGITGASELGGTELTNVFGSTGWTASSTTTQSVYTTSDIKDEINLTTNVNNRLVIKTKKSQSVPTTLNEYKELKSQSSSLECILTINGYMTI